MVKLINEFDISTVPLYRKIGLFNPDRAFLYIDIKKGECEYSNDHSYCARWSINPLLTADQLMDLFDEIKLDLINYASLDSERRSIDHDEIDRKIADITSHYELMVIDDLEEWLLASERKYWMPEPDANIDDFIANVASNVSDGKIILEDVEDVLIKMWGDELYNGETLPPNVAKYMLDHVWIGAWKEELEEMANNIKKSLK